MKGRSAVAGFGLLLLFLPALAHRSVCRADEVRSDERGASQGPERPAQETRYLAFQVFTYSHPAFPPGPKPTRADLLDFIKDVKGRIGTVGDRRTKLAVVLGPLAFDQTDADVGALIELGFTLALETDVAVGFHADDSIFWSGRKDLLSDPRNVESLDWEGTPCTARMLEWGRSPWRWRRRCATPARPFSVRCGAARA